MIRTVLTPDKQSISLTLPENFIGKKVEIIAFTVDDDTEANVLNEPIETYQASEKVLAKDWLTSEEDLAWKDL